MAAVLARPHHSTPLFQSPLLGSYTESSWAILGGIRFFLATIVFLDHLPWFLANPSLPSVLAWLPGLGGRAAVVGFLLISGFSIGNSLIARPEGYFLRRFFRIYPLYFFSVFSSVLLAVFLGSPYSLPNWCLVISGWKTSLANFFFLQGFVTITIGFNQPLWTISFEVFFYILAPFLAKLKEFWVYSLILSSLAGFLFFQRHWLWGYGALLYSWPWLIGFLLAIKRELKIPLILALLGSAAVFAIPPAGFSESMCWLTFPATTLLVFFSGGTQLSDNVRNLFNVLGELSYPLYLFHIPVCLFLFHFFGLRNPWHFIILTLVFVSIINLVFDSYLKKHFWKPLVKEMMTIFIGESPR